MSASSAVELDRGRLARWLLNQKMPSSRLARTFAHPLKNAFIAALRITGHQYRVAAPLFWGDQFHGFIPEAVTSLVWKYRFYDQSTSLFILRYLNPGDVFVDIGAHFGYFTLLAARLVGLQGRVVSIEAIPSTSAALGRNLVSNNIGNVETHNLAAFSEQRTLTFRDFGPALSSLNTAFAARGVLEGHDAPSTDIQVRAVPADQIIGTRAVSMIKIDTESSEEYVIAGLSRTIEFCRPTLIVELGGTRADEARVPAMLEALGGSGYEAFVLRYDGLEPVRHDRRLEYHNIAFIHPHHRGRFAINGPDTGRLGSFHSRRANERTRLD
jgi:FkbM family methyltransferase